MADRRTTGGREEDLVGQILDRITFARAPLAASALVLALGWLLGLASGGFVLAGWMVVLLATLVVPVPVPSGASQAAAERAAVWPETPMKAVVDALHDPAIVLDRTGVVRYLNQKAASAFPSTRIGNLLALTFRTPEFTDAIKAIVAGRPSAVQFQEGGQGGRTFAVMFTPLREPSSAGQFALVTFDDATDRFAVARIRSDFVANASHELRTPLASLTGFIETLLGPARNDPAAAERFLRIMLEQANRMRRLLDDLLSLSRLEMRAHRRPTEIVDVAGTVRHVADTLVPVAERFGVEIGIDLPPEKVLVTGDPDELVQVFQNLMENAIKYGAAGGRVDVRLAAVPAGAGKRVRISVRDYGPGIPPEHLPRLTERFYRVDVGASRERQGTGLGLAIVKHILARHQAQLLIESEPGSGAEFTVEMPVAPASSADRAA
ncbi:ATP-binding protein [Faunimonas sp. B44]|uniref:ATP-binding protein n=1 Tax=Faunimonas sp. B44 TaxID=3461493 RepID=UPI004043F310